MLAHVANNFMVLATVASQTQTLGPSTNLSYNTQTVSRSTMTVSYNDNVMSLYDCHSMILCPVLNYIIYKYIIL